VQFQDARYIIPFTAAIAMWRASISALCGIPGFADESVAETTRFGGDFE
jgi:hypothetical protein